MLHLSVSKGVIQRKKESQSNVTSSSNDASDSALWHWHSGKNLSETGIFSQCPLWSLWPTARYKHKEFLIQRLYLSRNLARSSHRRSLVLKTHSKERRGDL